jgi:hypothetical protein
MADIIRITPVQEVEVTEFGGREQVFSRRRCVKITDYRDYEINYDGDGKRYLERRA